MNPPAPDALQTQWLSRDFIEFNVEQAYDLVIVGSGYGAAMAAATFAGCEHPDGTAVRIAMLERGREYLPGAFPASLDELPGHVRISRGEQEPIGLREALWDVRLAGDVSALVCNGLGGGSLINAGVMVEPRFGSFNSRLPPGVEKDLTARPVNVGVRVGVEEDPTASWYDKARRMLGAHVRPEDAWQPNTVSRHPDVKERPLKKAEALKQLGRSAEDTEEAPVSGRVPVTREAHITVRLNAADNAGQPIGLETCTLCGDCLTGCNVGAKASLDTNLLVDAQRRDMNIYTSASVLQLERTNEQDGERMWMLHVNHTDPQVQARRGKPVQVRARHVVLAAGSFGSTEILLRSQRTGHLALSSRLGEQFSLNGDNVAFIRFPDDVNALSDEALPLDDGAGGTSPRRVGPEITQIVEWPAEADSRGPGFLVQEFAIPAALRGLFQEIVTTRGWMDELVRGDIDCHHAPEEHEVDPLAIDEAAMQRELMVGLIGHDSACGRIVLPRNDQHEGCVVVKWGNVGNDPAMAKAFERLQERVEMRLKGKARVTPNPLWRLLPEALRGIVGSAAGSALTVHPLGGCATGISAREGVVDPHGAVFNLDPDREKPGHDNWQGSLLVLDGSMVPASLGSNPALTIGALSLRAAEYWRSVWEWQPQTASSSSESTQPPPPPPPRPRARSLADCQPQAPTQPTKVQIVERLVGPVKNMKGPNGRGEFVVELTFAFESIDIHQLTSRMRKRLPLDAADSVDIPHANTLRIYRKKDWTDKFLDVLPDEDRQTHAEVVARLTGHMDLLVRQPSLGPWRMARAFTAFMRNRGIRDLRRLALKWLRHDEDISGIGRLLGNLLWLASQAGEVRRFDYKAHVCKVETVLNPAQRPFWENMLLDQPILGHKRFTYACGENPWNQLLYLDLDALGKAWRPAWWSRHPTPLKLDARFLAGTGLPLMRITQQQNQVRALSDLAQLGMYFTRLFLKLHLWHLRQPDPPSEDRVQRLPGAVKGLPVPEITEIELEPSVSKTNAQPRKPGYKSAAAVRLTRYRGKPPRTDAPLKPPLVFIHGYSASGTTFAHDAIKHNAARHFWKGGRDVWVLDLRTSAGMPTAQSPWAFEDVAWADIPVALDHIASKVGQERGGDRVAVDVFAHCIGAVMLSMALFTNRSMIKYSNVLPTRYPDELGRLHDNIHKLVLSQKGFEVVYTDENLLRSYLLNFLKPALRDGYSFRPPLMPRMRDRLLDAFLSALPYPPAEWSRDHPIWRNVPWSATRRRMDALYERTFNLENMPLKVLSRIDDFFGPLNLETVSQTIDFAREVSITKRNGDPFPTDGAKRWPRQGTLLISAQNNGMVNPYTTQGMLDQLKGAGILEVQRAVVRGGHQDCLIGRNAQCTWRIVEEFLDAH
jgi:choline dehydrogenase-like flavoprotein/pimeloyl-ACP methyl ester carboxylesterase